MDDTELIIALTALIGMIMGIWNTWQQRNRSIKESEKTDEEKKKIRAETTEIIQRLTAEQLEQQEKTFLEKEEDYEKRIAALEKSSSELRTTIGTLQADLTEVLDCLVRCVEGANELYNQVRRSGEEPIYHPPPLEFIKKRKASLDVKTKPIYPGK